MILDIKLYLWSCGHQLNSDICRCDRRRCPMMVRCCCPAVTTAPSGALTVLTAQQLRSQLRTVAAAGSDWSRPTQPGLYWVEILWRVCATNQSVWWSSLGLRFLHSETVGMVSI